jgi:hypothetical protein
VRFKLNKQEMPKTKSQHQFMCKETLPKGEFIIPLFGKLTINHGIIKQSKRNYEYTNSKLKPYPNGKSVIRPTKLFIDTVNNIHRKLHLPLLNENGVSCIFLMFEKMQSFWLEKYCIYDLSDCPVNRGSVINGPCCCCGCALKYTNYILPTIKYMQRLGENEKHISNLIGSNNYIEVWTVALFMAYKVWFDDAGLKNESFSIIEHLAAICGKTLENFNHMTILFLKEIDYRLN